MSVYVDIRIENGIDLLGKIRIKNNLGEDCKCIFIQWSKYKGNYDYREFSFQIHDKNKKILLQEKVILER